MLEIRVKRVSEVNKVWKEIAISLAPIISEVFSAGSDIYEVRWNHKDCLQGHYIPGITRFQARELKQSSIRNN